jgi:AraC-like DNA-binding protein
MQAAASYSMRTEREVIARVCALHESPLLLLRERADLRFVSVRYLAGSTTYPSLGFYAVSTRAGGAALIHEEGWRGGLLRAPAGTTFLQAPNRIVEYGCHEEHVACAMCIDPAEIEQAARETELANPDRLEILSRVASDPISAHLIAALAAQVELGNHPAQKLACEALRKAMAAHLLARFSVLAPHARGPRAAQALPARALRRAVAYLEDNLAQTCSLDELAAQAGVSSFVIDRQFRRTLGESPARYLLRARVERAKVLLAQRGHTPERVAPALGFSDLASFRRLFRRFTSVSPEQFARLHGNGLGSSQPAGGRPS